MLTAIQPRLASNTIDKSDNKSNNSNINFTARVGRTYGKAGGIQRAVDRIKGGRETAIAGGILGVLSVLDGYFHLVGWKETFPDIIGAVVGLLALFYGLSEIGAGKKDKARWN